MAYATKAQLAAETTARENADATEAKARQDADAALSKAVAALEARIIALEGTAYRSTFTTA